MEPGRRPRLIIVCGLPCSGKTTHARALESRLPAFRMCPDEWMDALGVNLWESATRCVCQLDLAPFDALIWPHLVFA
jgi:hypothetical protein